jgi:hypothetical protein
MTPRLLWPEVPEAEIEEGWLPEAPRASSDQVLDALAKRHPMDGFNGMPGRWVFVREVQAATGSYSSVQRFDAVAVGLVPSNEYARVVYEVKVSRADWLRELKPQAELISNMFRARSDAARRLAAEVEQGLVELMPHEEIRWIRKWEAALEISTEFYVAAPPHCVQIEELPPEAGYVEVRPWGPSRELRAKVIRQAPVRKTPVPDAAFWSAVLRRVAERR